MTYPPGSEAAQDDAFAVLEIHLTTKVMPEHAGPVTELLASKRGRDLMLACATNGYDTETTKRVITNVLILQGKIKP